MAVLADCQQINGDCSNIQGAKVKLEYNNQTFYLCRLNPLKLPQVLSITVKSRYKDVKYISKTTLFKSV